jgi:hypothetical protein
MHQAEPLGIDFAGEEIDPGGIAARLRQAGDETEHHRISPTPKTIGIVVVAALAASAVGLLAGVAMTATFRRMASLITAAACS